MKNNERKNEPLSVVDLDERLTEHFSLGEMLRSCTADYFGIDNVPTVEQHENMQALCEKVLEPLRKKFGVIIISSGFRNPRLNQAVGGSPQSQHMRGEAADILVLSDEQGDKMFRYIRDHLPFDQLLYEHKRRNGRRWIHVSYVRRRRPNRHKSASFWL